MKRKIVLGWMVAVAWICAPALAWNNTGHMTVALLAYRQLNDAQKQQIDALFRKHPHYAQFLNANVPAGVDAREWAFMKAATWPDWIRPAYPGQKPKDPAITKYHQPSWHYINLFFLLPSDIEKIDPKELPEKQAPNAVTAMEEAMKTLSSADQTDEEKAIMLCWLEHLVGDIHQPLHATTLVSTQHPKGDRGGNDEMVKIDGKVMNLHSFWDEVLGTGEEYSAIALIADHITASPDNQSNRMGEMQKDTTFISWAEESHDWGVSVALLGGNLKAIPSDEYKVKKDDMAVPVVPVSYEANARLLAEHRAALAGQRLAAKLSEIFKP